MKHGIGESARFLWTQMALWVPQKASITSWTAQRLLKTLHCDVHSLIIQWNFLHIVSNTTTEWLAVAVVVVDLMLRHLKEFQLPSSITTEDHGLIPDEVTGFFNWPNPSSIPMALGSNQPLTGVPGIFLQVKGGQHIRLTTSPPSVSWLPRKLEVSTSHNPLGLHGLLQGLLYL
jgi:hypothetical protein